MNYLYLYTEVEKKRHIFLDKNDGEIVAFGEEDTSPSNQFKLSVGMTVLIGAVVRLFNNSFLIDKRSMLIIFTMSASVGFIFQRWISNKNIKKQILKERRILIISQANVISTMEKKLITNYKFIVCTIVVEIVIYFLNIKNQNLFLNFFLIVLPILIGMGIRASMRMKQNKKKILNYWEKSHE